MFIFFKYPFYFYNTLFVKLLRSNFSVLKIKPGKIPAAPILVLNL